MDPTRYFQHIDPYLICFILATDKAELLDIMWDNNDQTTFVFNNPQVCERLHEEYFSHKALIDPFQFANTLREIKSRLYANR